MDALVLAAATLCRSRLTPYVDRDWSVRPAEGEWTVTETVFHVNDVLYYYAAQILLADPDDYVCVELAADDHATPARLLAALTVNARLLAAAVATADPDSLAHHTFGASDPEGFAAMGGLEMLVHTWDAGRTLDPAADWRPPDELAAPVVARLFAAEAPPEEAAPGDRLLYLCGRTPLGDRPQRTDWRWDGTPLRSRAAGG